MPAAERIVSNILDKQGLGTSTWEEKYPEAYKDLLEYRNDLEQSVRRQLRKEKFSIEMRN